MDSSQTPDGKPADDDLKAQHFEEFRDQNDQQARRIALRERQPTLYARVTILESIAELQEARGGEFPPKFVFVHMPDYILNIRRVGKVSLESLTVAFEVYEHSDIIPGVLFVPLDHIWWVGTTDNAVGSEQVSLRKSQDPKFAHPEEYQDLRLKLAGLPKIKAK
jgi:hypothetical protein